MSETKKDILMPEDGPPVRYIDLSEFRQRGYLQEVNRLFFHPLGMALELRQEDDGAPWTMRGVWDYRDDPEGIYFADGVDPEKAARVKAEWEAKASGRRAALGYMVQPTGNGASATPPEVP